jgi:hypothetical protein
MTSHLHMRGMSFSENESPLDCNMGRQGLNKKNMCRIHFSCDEAIECLNKKCRVSYHNLEKIIRQIRLTSNKQIDALNKKHKIVYEKLGESEIHPNFHQVISPLGKRHRVSY